MLPQESACRGGVAPDFASGYRAERSVKPSFSKTKVLITVMTYPHPSETHQELVCTAGITEAGEWVRLYPIDYRYRPTNQQFRKYQWIEIGLADHGAGNDNRRESRNPDLESIRLLGEPISTMDIRSGCGPCYSGRPCVVLSPRPPLHPRRSDGRAALRMTDMAGYIWRK